MVNVTVGESYVNDLRSVPTSELKLITERIDGPAPAEVAKHWTDESDFQDVVLHDEAPMDIVGELPRLPKLKPYTVTLEPVDVARLGGAVWLITGVSYEKLAMSVPATVALIVSRVAIFDVYIPGMLRQDSAVDDDHVVVPHCVAPILIEEVVSI